MTSATNERRQKKKRKSQVVNVRQKQWTQPRTQANGGDICQYLTKRYYNDPGLGDPLTIKKERTNCSLSFKTQGDSLNGTKKTGIREMELQILLQ